MINSLQTGTYYFRVQSNLVRKDLGYSIFQLLKFRMLEVIVLLNHGIHSNTGSAPYFLIQKLLDVQSCL